MICITSLYRKLGKVICSFVLEKTENWVKIEPHPQPARDTYYPYLISIQILILEQLKKITIYNRIWKSLKKNPTYRILFIDVDLLFELETERQRMDGHYGPDGGFGLAHGQTGREVGTLQNITPLLSNPTSAFDSQRTLNPSDRISSSTRMLSGGSGLPWDGLMAGAYCV